MKHMPDVELSTALWRFVIIAALLIGVGCCILGGCIPGFVQDHVEATGVFGGMLKGNENLPPDVRKTGAAMEASADAGSDKIGTSGKPINENNLDKRFGESQAGAEAYVPWYQQIPSTGMPWLDAIVALMTTGASAYFFRKPIRGLLHAGSHNPKEKVDEVG
jgi:hypothetical protein